MQWLNLFFSVFSFNLKVLEFFCLRKCPRTGTVEKIPAKFQFYCLWCPLPRSLASRFLLLEWVESRSTAFIFTELITSPEDNMKLEKQFVTKLQLVAIPEQLPC